MKISRRLYDVLGHIQIMCAGAGISCFLSAPLFGTGDRTNSFSLACCLISLAVFLFRHFVVELPRTMR